MSLIDRTRAATRGVAVAALGLVTAAHAENASPRQPAVIQMADAPVSVVNQPPAEQATVASGSELEALGRHSAPGWRTILNAADLDARGIVGLDGIAATEAQISYAPAVNSLATLSPYMRGEGPVAPGQITLDGAVGMYQDGLYISRLQSNVFDLLDPARVEVLAGAQGAMYGADAAGGVIDITSRAPSGRLDFNQDVDFGNRDSYRILSALDASRWHGLSARVTLLASSIDGYVKNQLGNTQDYGAEKQRAARLQLRWDALSRLQAEYFIERSALDSTAEYDSNPLENGQQPYFGFIYHADPSGPMRLTYRPIDLPVSPSNHTAQGLTLTWRPSSTLKVRSLTGYRTMTADEQQDYAEFYGYPSVTVDWYNVRQLSQDLSFSGELPDGQLGYAAGVTYFKESGEHSSEYILPAQNLFEETESEHNQITMTTRSQATYAQLRWRPAFLSYRLEFTVASRYTRDTKDASRVITENQIHVVDPETFNHLSYNRLTPEGALTFHLGEHHIAYAKVSTAYVAGGALETAPIGSFNSAHFLPESSTTYESGLRSMFLDDRLHAAISLFESRRRDAQYALPVNPVTDDVMDLQRVTVQGGTLALHVAPLTDLTLSAGATYLRWSIDRADVPAGTIFDPAAEKGSPYVVGQNINRLFALPYTPRYGTSIAGDYTFTHLDRKEILAHVDYAYRARMFVAGAAGAAGPGVPGNQYNTQQPYGLLNARIMLSQETDWSHRVKFSVWGRNILNRKYYQPAFGVGGGLTSFDNSGGVATPSGYSARIGAWAEPATYGVAIRYEY